MTYRVEYLGLGGRSKMVWFVALETASYYKADLRARRIEREGRTVRIAHVPASQAPEAADAR